MALASILPCVAHAAQIDVVATQTITDPSLVTGFGPNVKQINANTTWTKDNIYILKDKVFVTNGATLTIEAGTKIYSTLDPNGAGTSDDIFGSLVITRGAKIQANGTAAEPIVFTTIDEFEAATQADYAFDNDGIGGANDSDGLVAAAPTPATAGRWGGVVILGNAPVMNQNGSGVNIGEDRIEGFQPASSNDLDIDGRADVIEYGGATPADDSGTFRYVSIRHGGFVFSGANEINGLTLGGVGNGTDIDHVEVYANKDDGIEFFGGTVNTSHMVMAFNQDDAFDIDQGYSGTNQFWFCVQDPFEIDGVTSGHDNGGEWDGYTGGNTGTDLASGSNSVIYNATFIGSGTAAPLGNDKGNNGIFIEDRFRGKVYNSLFHDFREDLIESASDGPGTGLKFAHNTIGAFGGGITVAVPADNLTYLNGAGAANTFFDVSGNPINGNSNGGVAPQLTAYIRDASNYLEFINPLPKSASPLLQANGATLQTGAPVAATFRGAFGSTNWAAGWTRFDEAGLFTQRVDVVAEQTITDPSLVTGFGPNVKQINANTTWTKDNIYILKDKVFVTNGATLTIEAGTKIYSTLDPNGAGTSDDIFGSLVITRGAKIQANGTAAEPIVFTTIDEFEAATQADYAFDNDGIGGANDSDGLVAAAPTPATAGRWGGVVILGNAPVMNQNGSGVNIGEDRIEGFQPASSNDLDIDGRADVIEYGGATPADDSGTFRYVSIRHGGFVFSGANEINGLTLGGVGNGTDIDHVEVYANKDDGIEFFGGTVNTSHMVMAFNQDDAFDIDQGYSGTNQFWFCVQDPFEIDGVTSGHDNGGEWDGYTGGNTGTDLASGSNSVIYNATFIGSGTAAPLGNDKGNNGIFIEDRFRGKVYNSLFHDFREDLIESASDGPGTGLKFAHNTIGAFGGGITVAVPADNLTYLNGAGAANTFFDVSGNPINGNSNGGVAPQLTAYIRDASNYLEFINPLPKSASPLLQANGATLQTGAPVAATFRGAFGSTNWAAGWTSMSQQGLLLGEASTGSIADADGDGISDAVENANTDLGFNAAVSDANTVLGSLYTTTEYNTNFTAGQTSVTSNPNAFSLYNTADILDLRTTAGVTVQAPAGPPGPGVNVLLSVPVEQSDTLGGWTNSGNMTLSIPKVAGKEFYRLEVKGAQ